MSTLATTSNTTPPDTSQIKAVKAVLMDYIKGGTRGDVRLMRRAFHENAVIHGYFDGELLAGPIQLLFEWVQSNAPSPDLRADIVRIDLANSIATARIEITGWLGHRFTDQFTLFKGENGWQITSKVFHTH